MIATSPPGKAPLTAPSLIDLDMIVKDMIQMLSDFDENMEVGIRSTCGMLDMIVSMKRHHASIVGSQDFVLIEGVIPSEYYTNKKD